MTIRINKKMLVGCSILAIIMAVYNIIFFVIPWRIDANAGTFWVTYGFTWVMAVFAGIVSMIAFGKKELKFRIFGIPLFYVGATAVVVQLIIDAVVMGVGSWFEVQYWIVLIVEAIVLAFLMISAILRATYRNFIDVQDNKYAKKTGFIDSLRVEANTLSKLNKENELAKDLSKLSETINYADPVSNEHVVDIEDQITTEFEKLTKAVNENNVPVAKEQIIKISTLLDERKIVLKRTHI